MTMAAHLLNIVQELWRTAPTSFLSGSDKRSHRQSPHITLVFLTFTALSLLAAPGTGGARHRCYVCMPNDKNSSTAKDIETHFPGVVVPDCSNFPRVIEDDYADNALEFQFDCPPNFVGCGIRSNGLQISRICTPKPFQGCMYPNGVELCYCTHSLCNRDNATAQAKPPYQPLRTSRFFGVDGGVTDDEDLIPGTPRSQHHRQLPSQGQDHPTTTQSNPDELEEEDEGSGQHYDEDESEEYEDEEEKALNAEVTRIANNRSRGYLDLGRQNLTSLVPSDNRESSHSPGHYDPVPSPGGDKNRSSLDLDAPSVEIKGKGQTHELSRFLLSILLLLHLVNRQS